MGNSDVISTEENGSYHQYEKICEVETKPTRNVLPRTVYLWCAFGYQVGALESLSNQSAKCHLFITYWKVSVLVYVKDFVYSREKRSEGETAISRKFAKNDPDCFSKITTIDGSFCLRDDRGIEQVEAKSLGFSRCFDIEEVVYTEISPANQTVETFTS